MYEETFYLLRTQLVLATYVDSGTTPGDSCAQWSFTVLGTRKPLGSPGSQVKVHAVADIKGKGL